MVERQRHAEKVKERSEKYNEWWVRAIQYVEKYDGGMMAVRSAVHQHVCRFFPVLSHGRWKQFQKIEENNAEASWVIGSAEAMMQSRVSPVCPPRGRDIFTQLETVLRVSHDGPTGSNNDII